MSVGSGGASAGMPVAPDRRSLPPELAALADRFVLREETLEVAGRTFMMAMPRSAEDLISEDDFARDERLPYWADLWTSAQVLAEEVAATAGAGRRALELGCGLGVPSLAALAAGYDVTATDYYDDALRFCRWNALRAGLPEPATRLVDWRALPADLGRFDLVLAADVLYERPYGSLVAGAVLGALAPGGAAWVADPGRVGVEGFREACAARGAVVRERRVVTRPGPTGATQRITVLAITREGR